MTTSMNRTVTALFDTRADALKTVEELVRAGIPRSAIRITPETDVTPRAAKTSYDTTTDEKGFWSSLADLFMPEEDRYTYAEAMDRGSILVTVSTTDDLAERAEDVLEQHGTVNVSEREETWRKEGWTGYRPPAAAVSSGTSSGSAGATSAA